MIYQYSFPFGISNLEITSEKAISKSILELIEDLILLLKHELNNNIPESSANRLEKSNIGIPVFVNPIFLDYFNLVLEISKKNPELKLIKSKVAPEEAYILSNIDNAIIKLTETSLNSAKLYKYFAIENIIKILEYDKKINYLITYENINATFSGKYLWKSRFHSVFLKRDIEFKFQNKFALFEPVEIKEIFQEKFATIDEKIKLAELILFGDSLINLNLLKHKFIKNYYLNDFKEFTKFHNLNAILITEEKKIISI